jgi:hypothetical protein
MTTNCVDKLDKALIRPGRVDFTMHFGVAQREQVRDVCACVRARVLVWLCLCACTRACLCTYLCLYVYG